MEIGQFKWNVEKSAWLKVNRGIGFDDVVEALASGNFLAEIVHPTRPNQFLYIINFANYVYGIPFVKDGNNHFLKTIYPDRKLFAKYMRLQ